MSALNRFKPFRELEAFARRFEDFFSRGDMLTSSFGGWKPSVDIHEHPEHFEVVAELPGVKKEDVDISMDDGVLSISGERKGEVEKKDATAYRVERSFGRFDRVFTLPPTADDSKVDASYKDGVLTLKIMKRAVPEKAARKIEIAG